jgi:hypothetical protein
VSKKRTVAAVMNDWIRAAAGFFQEPQEPAEQVPTVPPGNAGAGTQEPPTVVLSGNEAMNIEIRRKAGR